MYVLSDVGFKIKNNHCFTHLTLVVVDPFSTGIPLVRNVIGCLLVMMRVTAVVLPLVESFSWHQ